jgi:hypothetical protein
MNAMSDVDDVLVAALRLPAEARAAVAAELIESLDGVDAAEDDVEAAWSEEIRQRLADVDAGVVTPIPWLSVTSPFHRPIASTGR